MNNSPIFIHSLFRSGSTYLFNVFRRTGNYWCYQEPENEWLLELDNKPEALLAVTTNNGGNIHHPDIGKPYFWEFHEVRDSLRGLFKQSFCFDDLFLEELSADQRAYYQALIEASRARTMFQFCRSFGQPQAFKSLFGGIHVHLWREPRSQWWSFKINDYFDAATQLIYGAAHLPPALQAIKTSCRINPPASENLGTARAQAERSPLKWRENYRAFFALWLYAQLELRQQADLDLSIDRLSQDAAYRDAKLVEFRALGINDIDLSDSRSPLIRLTSEEAALFREIEEEVANVFKTNGFTYSDIQTIFAMIDEIQDQDRTSVSGAAANIRGVALRLLDRRAEVLNENLNLQDTLQRLSDHIANQDRAIKLLNDHGDAARKQIADYDNAVSRLQSYSADLEEALKKVQDYAENLDRARLQALEQIESLETELSQLRPTE
ncbi:hypothetical protein [Pseudomonas pseudonitroreducens]|uniref:hypothetical protein n=1 Tax=Pseudomonas pseudonitroreducens TaxID=2892326 RepID=UPI001F34B3E2|nr:hypothetical protein [Pseudomonas pseudonitroreducens]